MVIVAECLGVSVGDWGQGLVVLVSGAVGDKFW